MGLVNCERLEGRRTATKSKGPRMLTLTKLLFFPSSIRTTASPKNLASASPRVQLVVVRASGVREAGGAGFPGHWWFPGSDQASHTQPDHVQPPVKKPARWLFTPPYSHRNQLAARILGACS